VTATPTNAAACDHREDPRSVRLRWRFLEQIVGGACGIPTDSSGTLLRCLAVYCSAACKQKGVPGRGGHHRRSAPARGPPSGGWCGAHTWVVGHGRWGARLAAALGASPVTVGGLGSLSHLGPWRPSFVGADPFPPTVTCGGSGWSLFVSSLAYTRPGGPPHHRASYAPGLLRNCVAA